MHICIYVCNHTYLHIYAHHYIAVCVHKGSYIYIYIYMYLQIYTNIHICIYIPTTLKPHNFEKQVTKRLEKVFNKGFKQKDHRHHQELQNATGSRAGDTHTHT